MSCAQGKQVLQKLPERCSALRGIPDPCGYQSRVGELRPREKKIQKFYAHAARLLGGEMGESQTLLRLTAWELRCWLLGILLQAVVCVISTS